MKRNNVNRKLAKIVAVLIPIIVFFDWLVDFELIEIKIGLYLKGLLTLVFGFFILKSKTSKFQFKNVFLYFLFIFILYSILSEDVVDNLYSTIRIAYWVLGAIIFYAFFRNKILSQSAYRNMIVATSIIASFFTILLMSQAEEHQNASAYLLLWCLPMLIYFKDNRASKIMIVISIVSIILTIKRGAILALIVSIICYFIVESRRYKSARKKVRIYFTGLLIASLISVIGFLQWESISKRLEDTSGSGRDIMYEIIINDYIDSSAFHFLFGHGINSVQELTALKLAKNTESAGISAHSDWLQNTYDFGLFGFLLMIMLHVQFLKLLRFNYKNRTQLFSVVLMAYIIFSLSTIYSFILSVPDAIFMGISLAFFSSEKNKLVQWVNYNRMKREQQMVGVDECDLQVKNFRVENKNI